MCTLLWQHLTHICLKLFHWLWKTTFNEPQIPTDKSPVATKRGQQTVKVISSDLHVKENVFVDQVLPFAHADKVVVDAFQFCCSHLQQEVGEFLLPFLTVSEEGQLQWIAVQKHKLDIQYCLVHLYVVCNFCVPVRCSMLKLTT